VLNVRGHRTYIAGPHAHVGLKFAGVLVAHLPVNLAIELDKPLDPIVTVLDRQAVFLRGWAKQAVLQHRHDRRVPGHIRARQVFVEVHQAELAFMARFDVQLPLLEPHAFEPSVDRELRILTVFLLDEAGGNYALAMNGAGVTGALGSDSRTRLARRGEGVEVGRNPVFQNLGERVFDLSSLQFFGMPEPVLVQGFVILAAEDLNRAVVVNGAEDIIELDHTVEKAPGDVTLQRSEEGIDVYPVFHRFTRLGWKVNVSEIIVAGKTKLAELKFFVRVHRVPPCL
jgi:hypothetical protein